MKEKVLDFIKKFARSEEEKKLVSSLEMNSKYFDKEKQRILKKMKIIKEGKEYKLL